MNKRGFARKEGRVMVIDNAQQLYHFIFILRDAFVSMAAHDICEAEFTRF